MANMFDPDFDPLEMLYATMEALAKQHETIGTIIEVHNNLNRQVYELNRTNSMLITKIMKLESRLNEIEQASKTDRARRE